MTPEDIRKKAETYVPNIEAIADKLIIGEFGMFSAPREEMKALQEMQAVIEKAKAR